MAYSFNKALHIGLVDADLLCNGTRHPNLALLKIAGYFRDNGYIRGYSEGVNSYELITNESKFDQLLLYDYFYVSFPHTAAQGISLVPRPSENGNF